jgi:hypothetical protein
MSASTARVDPDEFVGALRYAMSKMASSRMWPSPTTEQWLKAVEHHGLIFFKDKPDQAEPFVVRFSAGYRALEGMSSPVVPSALWRHVAVAPLVDGGAVAASALAKAAAEHASGDIPHYPNRRY